MSVRLEFSIHGFSMRGFLVLKTNSLIEKNDLNWKINSLVYFNWNKFLYTNYKTILFFFNLYHYDLMNYLVIPFFLSYRKYLSMIYLMIYINQETLILKSFKQWLNIFISRTSLFRTIWNPRHSKEVLQCITSGLFLLLSVEKYHEHFVIAYTIFN